MAFDVTRKVRGVAGRASTAHFDCLFTFFLVRLFRAGNVQELGQMVQRAGGILPWNTDNRRGQQNRW